MGERFDAVRRMIKDGILSYEKVAEYSEWLKLARAFSDWRRPFCKRKVVRENLTTRRKSIQLIVNKETDRILS